MRTMFAVAGALGLAAWLGLSSAAIASRCDRDESRYADGVYTATGWYGGQPSRITVTITLKDDVVAAVMVRPHATVPESLRLQRLFAAAVPKVVVGKRIEDVHVGRLAGSSGTPKGFNDAVQRIRKQARRPVRMEKVEEAR